MSVMIIKVLQETIFPLISSHPEMWGELFVFYGLYKIPPEIQVFVF